jgi:hypothetical protein
VKDGEPGEKGHLVNCSPLTYLAATGLILALESSCLAQETAPEPPRSGDQPASGLSIPACTFPWEATCPGEVICGDPESSDEWGVGPWSLQFIAGYYPRASVGSSGVPFELTPDRKAIVSRSFHFDLVPLTLRLGWAPCGTVLRDLGLRGQAQVLLEYTADPVTRNFGHYVTGPSVLLRYNFFQHTDSRFVPYLQAGAGLVLNDAYHVPEQRLIGGPVEFLLQAQLGCHYFLNASWSLDAEGGYQHISNADLYDRNVGVNSFGGSIGFTYHFGCRCH